MIELSENTRQVNYENTMSSMNVDWWYRLLSVSIEKKTAKWVHSFDVNHKIRTRELFR